MARSMPKWFDIYYVVGAIIILLQMAGMFVKGGIVTSTWISILVGLTIPFAIIVSVGTLLQVNIKRLTERKSRDEVITSSVFFIVFLSVLVVTFTLGTGSDTYWYVYDILQRHVFLSALSLCGFSLVLLIALHQRPKNLGHAWMVAMTALSFMMVSPLGDLLWPPISSVALFFYLYPGAVGYQMLVFGLNIGLFTLVIRTLIGKQKLRSIAR